MPIYIDDAPYPAAPEKNLLEHGLSLGLDIPYFCWHPAMGAVGACRQCAVKQYKDENDTRGRLVMACMTPAAEGTRIGLHETEATAFRASVIEWLMLNHPHDCPVCEEGGECHLQDMTVMTGHDYRRYRGRKRTFRNQYLGPFVQHEMNRCIACYRCVRFYRDYAGGEDLHAFAAHQHVYFGRYEDGVLESPFSGNLVEVCPTGVFTDKTFSEHYIRKWDLQAAPSVCVHCSLGCNTQPGERYGVLRRIVNRFNGDVNGYFLCDRGRYGYGFVNGDQRIRRARLSAARGERGERAEAARPAAPVEAEAALGRAAELLAEGTVVGIGSPRASLEANFALRELVGADNFYAGVSAAEDELVAAGVAILRHGSTRAPSLADCADADAVLVLGEDPARTAPRLALALRQTARAKQAELAAGLRIPSWQDAAVRIAGQNARYPIFVATPAGTRIDAVAETLRAAPDELARLGFAVARRLDDAAPDVPELADATAAFADRAAAALGAARRPLIVSGTGSGSRAVLEAAANVARALTRRRGRPAELSLVLPEANSLGLALLGGDRLEAVFERARTGQLRAAVVLENDLHRRASPRAVAEFLAHVPHLVVVDAVDHETARAAEVVLPAAAFAEGDGTLVSQEGRAQRFFQVFVPAGDIRESWRWLAELLRRAGRPCGWQSLDDVTDACARDRGVLGAIRAAAPNAKFRIAGRRINREPARYSGRTAMHANSTLHEPAPPSDPDSALSFSMEGYHGPRLPGALIPFFWAPGWNSNQSVNKFQDETGRHLRDGDAGVRLFEPERPAEAAAAAAVFFQEIPPAPRPPPDGRIRLVTLHDTFGGEELSALAPAIAARAPAPSIALHPADAEVLGLSAGQATQVVVGEQTLTVPLRLEPSLAPGVAALPAGLTSVCLPAGIDALVRPAPSAGAQAAPEAPAP